MANSLTKFSEKYFHAILALLFLIVFVYVLQGGILLYNDSDGYLDMSIIRLPLYPLLLKLLYYENFSVPLLLFQEGIICFSIYVLLLNLKKHLLLASYWYILLAAILVWPCFSGLKIANSILSEPIAYSLYLLCFSFLSTAYFTLKKKYVLYGLAILFLLLLTRGQFLYIVIIVFMLAAWISYQKKNFVKNVWLFILIIALPFLVSTTDSIYHKTVNGHYVTTPWSGIHLITPAFYVADETDYSIYEGEEERAFFKAIYSKLYERKLNIHHPEVSPIDPTSYYQQKYTRITNYTIYDYGKTLLGQNLSEDEKFIKLDRLTKEMSTKLILNNFPQWAKLNFKNFMKGFGGYQLALFFGVIFIFSFVKLRKNPKNFSKILLLASLFTIANVAAVAIVIHTINRFTFYNDWVFFLILFILLNAIPSLQAQKPEGKTPNARNTNPNDL